MSPYNKNEFYINFIKNNSLKINRQQIPTNQKIQIIPRIKFMYVNFTDCMGSFDNV